MYTHMCVHTFRRHASFKTVWLTTQAEFTGLQLKNLPPISCTHIAVTCGDCLLPSLWKCHPPSGCSANCDVKAASWGSPGDKAKFQKSREGHPTALALRT